jgi:methylated-DNA-[protein]-cysteine S-methyltransferase
MSTRMVQAGFSTPWGRGHLVVEDGYPREIRLPVPGEETPDLREDAEGSGVSPGDEIAARRWAEEIESYFLGTRLSWPAQELPLERIASSPFRRAVYSALLQVPAGVTISYGALAQLAGYPGAARAVGTAMATNPLPILIPCHRVVRSDGSLGRFGSCDALKPWLLEHEGRVRSEECEASTA